MNKYQEALEILCTYADGNPISSGEFVGKMLQEADDTLQELVEKDTPKKVIRSVFYDSICPNCNTRIDEDVEFEATQRLVEGEDNYCPYCGQRLIYWGEE